MKDDRSLTPAQGRAGRALLGWSQRELAARAGVAEATVTQFERGTRSPSRAVAWAMRSALEAGGVEFIAAGDGSAIGGGEGVRLRAAADVSDADPPPKSSTPSPRGG
ncbi:helix-turn-helix domain-containing protein [Roseicella frigidaeris]|uniref:XRE family transcriptional regulator n=1 Tax=Roseicella frigidaeris TaxID=2230885 RepID=A0A327LX86_9PROT|nr:helix-turn-helix transcriptional regulator [Roseicella frigidaeris]RAI54545.1 XRE family transcriptional regulator [Roseicella frigidaeris]